jgi:hypothetical protein
VSRTVNGGVGASATATPRAPDGGDCGPTLTVGEGKMPDGGIASGVRVPAGDGGRFGLICTGGGCTSRGGDAGIAPPTDGVANGARPAICGGGGTAAVGTGAGCAGGANSDGAAGDLVAGAGCGNEDPALADPGGATVGGATAVGAGVVCTGRAPPNSGGATAGSVGCAGGAGADGIGAAATAEETGGGAGAIDGGRDGAGRVTCSDGATDGSEGRPGKGGGGIGAPDGICVIGTGVWPGANSCGGMAGPRQRGASAARLAADARGVSASSVGSALRGRGARSGALGAGARASLGPRGGGGAAAADGGGMAANCSRSRAISCVCSSRARASRSIARAGSTAATLPPWRRVATGDAARTARRGPLTLWRSTPRGVNSWNSPGAGGRRSPTRLPPNSSSTDQSTSTAPRARNCAAASLTASPTARAIVLVHTSRRARQIGGPGSVTPNLNGADAFSLRHYPMHAPWTTRAGGIFHSARNFIALAPK